MDRTYCAGRYQVQTVASEMRMSHWIEAPVVTRVEDGTTVLDLSEEMWDLQETREEDDVLLLVMRKYPGITNDVEVRILPRQDAFSIKGRTVTRQQLMADLREFP